jgi:molybdopterin-guanine dinucleotide biosynthesis protein A
LQALSRRFIFSIPLPFVVFEITINPFLMRTVSMSSKKDRIQPGLPGSDFILDCASAEILQDLLMTGVVLIGGKSQRYGSDKVLSQFKGQPLIRHVVDTIQPLFDEIILIGHKRKGLENFRVVEDIRPGCGPLGGIYTALNAAVTEYCFVCATDMPNLNAGLISHMISRTDGHDIVMPMWSKGREPLHAIYRRSLTSPIASLLDHNILRIFSLIEQADTLFIPEETIKIYGDPAVLFSNINTQHDMVRITS